MATNFFGFIHKTDVTGGLTLGFAPHLVSVNVL